VIVLGADVGATTGLAMLDCAGPRPRLVAVTIAREEVVTAVSGMLDLLAEQGRSLVAVGIETPAQVFEHGRAAESEGARRSIERALLVARDAAGQVRAVASMRAAGANVHDGQAHNVRRAVLGKLPREHLDRFIAQRLPVLVDGWPRVSNSHQRDAAIVALWAWQRERAGLKPGEHAPRTSRKATRDRDVKPTAEDLRRAGERVLRPAPVHHPVYGAVNVDAGGIVLRGERAAVGAAMQRQGREITEARANGRHIDPGDERPARELADCTTCGAKVPADCTRVGAERFVFGVHEARARAAGLHVPATRQLAQRECDRANQPTRKIATVPGQARLAPRRTFVVLPWENVCECARLAEIAERVEALRKSCACPRRCERGEDCLAEQKRARGVPGGRCYQSDEWCNCPCHSPAPKVGPTDPCALCNGTGRARNERLAEVPARDVEVATMPVPAAHVARWGRTITLHRRERTIAGMGVCWVYEMAKEGSER
jgi:hypothetical protein